MPETYVVDPEKIAKRAGLDPEDESAIEIIGDAILDAQADVEAYLGRVIVRTEATEHGVPIVGGRWVLSQHEDEQADAQPIEMIASTPEFDALGQATGRFTVRYFYGLDATADECRPIRRFVAAHALNSPEVTRYWETTVKARGAVKSVGAGQQSISYEKASLSGGAATAKPGDGTPGALPTMESLDYWRIRGRRVHTAPTQVSDWPFTGRRW